MSRHFFAGANTPDGFFSCFNQILPLEKINKKVYIKGGSGTGKSTLMKKTAALFEKQGHSTEYFHCSNDAESLDGICVENLNIAVVDGTSPHMADPQIPASMDIIFNAADFLDKDFLRENGNKLREMIIEKTKYYNKAYGYLKAAHNAYCINEEIYQSAINQPALNSQIFEALKNFSGMEPSMKSGTNRTLFATAITPDGVKSFIPSALKAEKTLVLEGIDAMGIGKLINAIQLQANILGLDTESYLNPLCPQKTEHLHIPALDVSLVTSNRYHMFEEKSEVFNFEEILNSFKIEKYGSEINYNGELFDELLQKSMRTMTASKDIHSKIEEIYIEGMDFKKMDRAYEKVLEYLSE